MKTGNVNAKEKNWRWTLRRGIASLLAAVECFSVVAVGAPASYAEWPEETPTAVEETMTPLGVDVKGENGTGEPDYLNYYDGVVSVYGEVPAGTEIGVFDVYADFEGFDPAYYDALAGTLTDEREEDGLYWQRTVERDYTLLTAQNIALSVNGESIQPEPGSPLEISISDPAISEERNLQLWHVDDYGYAERVTDFWVDGSSIRFMAESVSAYLVLQVMSRTTITVSDGETYQITVSYDQDAGLPEIADLSAWELYDIDLTNYVNQSAEVLGTEPEALLFARAFGVGLRDYETGDYLRTDDSVKVSISLLNTDVYQAEKLELFRFANGAELFDYALTDGVIEFETEEPDVYAILGLAAEEPDGTEDAEKGAKAEYETLDYADSAVSLSGEVPAGVEVTTTDVLSADPTRIAALELMLAQMQEKEPEPQPEVQGKRTLRTVKAVPASTDKNKVVLAAYDISLGEYQPDEEHPLRVSITDDALTCADGLQVWHLPDEGGIEEITDFTRDGNTVSFDVTGLSIYAVTGYTVDFHWGEYTYSIAGESEIALSALLENLSVTEITVADVADVSFSNADYIEIEQTDSDWLLRSLAAFSTEEALTLMLANGQSVEIKVTDAGGIPLTITAASDTKVYNGTELVNSGYTCSSGLREGDKVVSVTVTGSQTLAGEGDNEASDASILDENGEDVTALYDITYVKGTLTVEPMPLTVKAGSGRKVYDGTPLTADTWTTNTYLVGSDNIESVNFEGTQTLAGESPNTASNAVIVDENGENISFCYAITYEAGTLTVTQKPLTITAASARKIVDGTPLTANSWTSTELVEGDSIESVTVTGSQQEIGESPNVPSEAKIVNASGENVTSCYNITYVNGLLTVSNKVVTITAASGEKVYDGEELTASGWTSTELAAGDSIKSVTVTGSQVDAGSSDNVASGAMIINADGQDVTDEYTIIYNSGTLTVNPQGLP